MGNKFSISVLMSVYKPVEKYLQEAINSILNQTYQEFEFIIIIDGPDEKSLAVINSFNDNRIKIHQNAENLGLTKSLNVGLSLAKGKYIARMDADDISFPTRLQVQFDYMEKNDDVAACGSYAKNLGSPGFTTQRMSSNEEILKIRMMFYNAGIIHPTAFIRKGFLETHQIMYDELIKKSQDYAIWVDILQYGKIKQVSKVLLNYRRHDNQIINSKSSEVEEYTNFIRLRNWSRIGVDFNEKEKKILKSISLPVIEDESKDFRELFDRFEKLNNQKNIFNKRLFSAELNRLWFHLGLKRLRSKRSFDILLDLRMFKLLKFYNIYYILNFYLLDKIKPYMSK